MLYTVIPQMGGGVVTTLEIHSKSDLMEGMETTLKVILQVL